jgi:hypothetical protein
MLEILLSLGLIAGVLASGLAGALLPWPVLMAAGLVGVAVGMIAGVPAGLMYHVRLHAALAALGELPPRWWLRPTSFHDRLDSDQRARVMRWFYAGGAGFGFVVLGCILVLAGILRSE